MIFLFFSSPTTAYGATELLSQLSDVYGKCCSGIATPFTKSNTAPGTTACVFLVTDIIRVSSFEL